MHFSGDGQRKVTVGYVIEAPIWKTSYRLVLGKDAKPYLQGWAVIKNTTGANLSQGPVTVFEGSTYAGDARFLDISPHDERMIAFAIDLGCEVIPQTGDGKTTITQVKAQKGIVHVTRKQRDERTYKISNKSDTARTMVIEHPNRTNQQFKLVATAKPIEETEALWR